MRCGAVRATYQMCSPNSKERLVHHGEKEKNETQREKASADVRAPTVVIVTHRALHSFVVLPLIHWVVRVFVPAIKIALSTEQDKREKEMKKKANTNTDVNEQFVLVIQSPTNFEDSILPVPHSNVDGTPNEKHHDAQRSGDAGLEVWSYVKSVSRNQNKD